MILKSLENIKNNQKKEIKRLKREIDQYKKDGKSSEDEDLKNLSIRKKSLKFAINCKEINPNNLIFSNVPKSIDFPEVIFPVANNDSELATKIKERAGKEGIKIVEGAKKDSSYYNKSSKEIGLTKEDTNNPEVIAHELGHHHDYKTLPEREKAKRLNIFVTELNSPIPRQHSRNAIDNIRGQFANILKEGAEEAMASYHGSSILRQAGKDPNINYLKACGKTYNNDDGKMLIPMISEIDRRKELAQKEFDDRFEQESNAYENSQNARSQGKAVLNAGFNAGLGFLGGGFAGGLYGATKGYFDSRVDDELYKKPAFMVYSDKQKKKQINAGKRGARQDLRNNNYTTEDLNNKISQNDSLMQQNQALSNQRKKVNSGRYNEFQAKVDSLGGANYIYNKRVK